MSNTEEQEGQSLDIKKIFNVRLIKKGVLIFAVISIISMVAVFLYTNTGKTFEVWSQVKPQYLLLGLFFIFNELFLGGYRNHIFAKEFKPGISQRVCIRANVANIFMGAVTPGQTGGGAAQWYIWYKGGLKVPDMLTISIINFLSTLLFFPLSGLFAYFILKDQIDHGFVNYIIKYGSIVFSTLFVIILVAIIMPNSVKIFLQLVAKLISRVKKSLGDKMLKWTETISEKLFDYQKSLFDLIKRKPILIFYSFGLTVLLYFNKYALSYVLVLALGFDVDFLTVVSIQAVLYFLLYFSPSPGGSGIAEISIATLMTLVLQQDYIASFTLLYRSFLIFIPAMLGAYVVLKQLGKSKVD